MRADLRGAMTMTSNSEKNDFVTICQRKSFNFFLTISFSDVGHIVNNDVNHLLNDQFLFQVQFSQTSCSTSRSRLQLTITGRTRRRTTISGTRPMAVHNFIMAANFPLGFAPENGPHQVSSFLWQTQEKALFRGTWRGPFSGGKQSGKLPIMAVDQPDYQALSHLGSGATKSTYTGRTAVANIEDATITVLKPEGVQNDNWKVLVTLPLTTWPGYLFIRSNGI